MKPQALPVSTQKALPCPASVNVAEVNILQLVLFLIILLLLIDDIKVVESDPFKF